MMQVYRSYQSMGIIDWYGYHVCQTVGEHGEQNMSITDISNFVPPVVMIGLQE